MTTSARRVSRLVPGTVLALFMTVGLLVPLGLVVVQLADSPDQLGEAIRDSGSATIRSVLLAAGVSALALPIAVAIARPLSRASQWVRAVGVTLCGAPLVLNLLVVILAWMVVLEHDGLARWAWRTAHLPGTAPEWMFTPTAAMLAMIYVVTPVMALLLMYSFRQIDPRMVEAARLLGARPLTRLVRVELGYVAPSLVTAFVMGYVICLNLYLVPEYLTGPGLTTLGFLVQQDVIKSFDISLAAAHSVILLLAAVLPVCGALAVEWRVRHP